MSLAAILKNVKLIFFYYTIFFKTTTDNNKTKEQRESLPISWTNNESIKFLLIYFKVDKRNLIKALPANCARVFKIYCYDYCPEVESEASSVLLLYTLSANPSLVVKWFVVGDYQFGNLDRFSIVTMSNWIFYISNHSV